MASYVDGETHGSVLQSEGLEFLLSRGGERVPLTVLEGKTTCLFFSANWCRPCRNFTPRLAQLYDSLKSSGEKLEIVFVSFDRDESGFEEHLERMPWLAVPFDAGVRGRLCNRYRVERIPSLVPLASDGRRVEEDAIQLVEDYGVEAFPFGVKRRVELEAMGGNCETSSDAREEILSSLELASRYPLPILWGIQSASTSGHTGAPHAGPSPPC